MIIKMTGRSMVINVEYNQLDPLLRASGYPDGDVNSETGYSPFPGNINQVIIFSYLSQFYHPAPSRHCYYVKSYTNIVELYHDYLRHDCIVTISYFSCQLILELGPYIEELAKTGGAIQEFVNPK